LPDAIQARGGKLMFWVFLIALAFVAAVAIDHFANRGGL
jgi:hypothetical protein